ncbi:hypothetical protein PM082_010716 [Marasmius tenuissimus]|nr:hypothetical protein PM082_010716 [Marasmius tenuissimus]
MPSSVTTPGPKTSTTPQLPPALGRKSNRGRVHIESSADISPTPAPAKSKNKNKRSAPEEPTEQASKPKKSKPNNRHVSIDQERLAELTNMPEEEFSEMDAEAVDKNIEWLLSIKRRGSRKASKASPTTAVPTIAPVPAPAIAPSISVTATNTSIPVTKTVAVSARKTPIVTSTTKKKATGGTQPACPAAMPAIAAKARPALRAVASTRQPTALPVPASSSKSGKTPQVIKRIERPTGSPGQKNGGFNVQASARVDDDEQWKEFHRVVHDTAISVGIDFKRTYTKQDKELRRHVCMQVEEILPYFCPSKPRMWESDGRGNHTLIDDKVDPDASSNEEEDDEEDPVNEEDPEDEEYGQGDEAESDTD